MFSSFEERVLIGIDLALRHTLCLTAPAQLFALKLEVGIHASKKRSATPQCRAPSHAVQPQPVAVPRRCNPYEAPLSLTSNLPFALHWWQHA